MEKREHSTRPFACKEGSLLTIIKFKLLYWFFPLRLNFRFTLSIDHFVLLGLSYVTCTLIQIISMVLLDKLLLNAFFHVSNIDDERRLRRSTN